jgi:LysM repeat protein
MKNKAKYILFFLLFTKFAFGQNSAPEHYDFINYKDNKIESGKQWLLDSLRNVWRQNIVVIAHFGDSHVQPDHFTSVIRERLQHLKGSKGRGAIFPYAIAHTYSQNDYNSTFSGKWQTANSVQKPPKIPLGIFGFVATTKDVAASFSIRFKNPLDTGLKIVKVFCNKAAKGYTLTVNSRQYSKSVLIDTISDKTTPYIKFRFPVMGDTFDVAVNKDDEDENTFSLYGISVENKGHGLLYDNFGVGGAMYCALNYQTYFEQQFPAINADIAILDWGTNDIYYRNSIADDLQQTVINSINRIRNISPNTLILLTSMQDINFKGKNITAAKTFSSFIKKIAFENNCLFYDWFKVSGGGQGMKKWYNAKLAQKDNIHLSKEGYHLKGELFGEALQNAFLGKTSFSPPTFEPDEDLDEKPQQQLKKQVVAKPTVKKTKPAHHKSLYINYIVKKGETINSIAAKFNTTASEIMQVNKLKSKHVDVNQILKINQ